MVPTYIHSGCWRERAHLRRETTEGGMNSRTGGSLSGERLRRIGTKKKPLPGANQNQGTEGHGVHCWHRECRRAL